MVLYEGRKTRVRRAVQGWLADDDEIDAMLGAGGAVVPAARAASDDASPQLAVGVALQSTNRSNTREVEVSAVRVLTSATYDWVDDQDDGGLDALEHLSDRVVDVLTVHRPGWADPEVTRDEEVAPSDEHGRFVGVTEFSAEHRGIHPTHTE